MYCINIIDNNNRKLEVYKTKAQLDLDRFTTCFNNSDEIIEEFGLSPTNFRVSVEKYNEKDREKIDFLDSSFRGLISLGKNKDKQIEFIKSLTKERKGELHRFFLNEKATRFKRIKNDYDRNRYNNLDIIIKMLEEEIRNEYESEEYVQIYSDSKLEDALDGYFIDEYNKVNYDIFKSMYTFITELKGPSEKIELSDESKIHKEKVIKIMAKNISKAIGLDGRSFIDNSLPIEKDEISETNDRRDNDYINMTDKYDDIDKFMTEMDMYMDQARMDEEEKFEYIRKNKKRLF